MILALTLYRVISPIFSWSRTVEYTVILPLAVDAMLGAPRRRPYSEANAAGMTTSVAPVSSKNSAVRLLIVPLTR